jgi:hypothetical protein
MKGLDLVFDIETLSSEYNAAVIGVGVAAILDGKRAPRFDFEVLIEPIIAAQYGAVDPKTLEWWNQQPTKLQAWAGTMPEEEAIDRFNTWVNSLGYQPEVRTWGNAPAFDLVILRNLWKRNSKEWPFHFRTERCFRTALWLARDLYGASVDKRYAPPELQHLPLADAIVEAEILIEIYDAIGVPYATE